MSLKFSLDINPYVGLATNSRPAAGDSQYRMDPGYYGNSYTPELSRDLWRSPSTSRADLMRPPPALEVYPPQSRTGAGCGEFTASVELGQAGVQPCREAAAHFKTEKEVSVAGNALSFSDSLLALKQHSRQSPITYHNMTPPPQNTTSQLHLTSHDDNGPILGGISHPGMSYSPIGNMQHCGLPPPPPPLSYHHHHQGNPSMTSPGHSGMFPSMSVNVSMSMNVQGVPPSLQGVPPTIQTVPSSLHGQYEVPSQSEWHTRLGSQHGGSYYPPAGDLFHPTSHHTSYSPYGHHGYSSVYDSESALDKEPFYSYKQAATESVSRLYNLGTMNSRRGGGRVTGYEPVTGKVNLCRICGKTYARPSTLKTHMRTHSGEKPYKCQTCNKSFSQAANLTAHVRTHSGEKPFRCPVCDRRFSQSSSVTTHMRTHSGERPYRCRLCKKAFSDSSTLTKHLRIHSGEKPYQCKLCLLRFSQSGNLNRHMRVHTGQQQ